MSRNKMQYVGTLTSSTTSIDVRLKPDTGKSAVQVAGALGAATGITLKLGSKDEAGVVQFGDVADNEFTDEFSVEINVPAEFARISVAGADGSTDLNVYVSR